VVREHQPALAQVRRPLPPRRRAAEDFADWHAAGAGFAGTPAKAIEYVAAQEEEAGINYFCADLAFGDITFEEASRTVELFEGEIIPAFDPVAAK
jgi:ferric-dicitrate binding protein FerR (iron transport regulator)